MLIFTYCGLGCGRIRNGKIVVDVGTGFFRVDYIKDLDNSLRNGEKDYKSKWDNKGSLVFKYYDSSKQIGFDKALKKHAYIFNSDTETFKQKK